MLQIPALKVFHQVMPEGVLFWHLKEYKVNSYVIISGV